MNTNVVSTEQTLTASSFIAALNTFDESTYQTIMNTILGIRKERTSESSRIIADLEAQLKAARANCPVTRSYKRLVNPKNPNETYTTGKYMPWIIDWAQSDGVNTTDKNAMKTWVKKNAK